MTIKLLEMSQSIEDRIEQIKKNCNQEKKGDGFLFASIETPQMIITVGQEFIIYLQRYGPPHHGRFDPYKLESIREEFGIPTPVTT